MGAAIAPIASSLAGGSALGGGGLFGTILSSVASNMFAPDTPSAPAPAALPPAPEPQAAPVAPPAVEKVATQEPVVDTEAARVRAAKRRKEAGDRRLFSLSKQEDESVVLTKSLLGE